MKRLAVLLTLIAAPAGATETYHCAVQDFSTFTRGDTAFIENNLKKDFLMNVGSGQIQLDMKSEHYGDAITTYRIAHRRNNNLTALDDDPARLGALTVPKNIQARLDRNGYFNATLSVNGSFYANTWLLRCQ